MDLELTSKIAIVTGASRGLGRAIAQGLVAEGARVLAVARSTGDLESLAAQHPDHVVPQTCDMLDRDAVRALVGSAIRRFGGLDIVVNNAGIAPAARFVDQDQNAFDRVFDVNVVAPAILARAAGEVFLGQGAGKVINVASTSGIRGKPMLVAYSASKAALIRLTEALAAEWAPHGVQVNAIAPGAFETHAQQAVLDDPDLLDRRTRRIPARRMADPSEIGPLAAYLASPRSAFVTGATFVIDGGEVAKL